MKVRGQRECRECGTRWSYYETGEVACPNCDSLRSRGIDERTEHTDTPVTLDLTPARTMVEREELSAALDSAAEECRTFVVKTGFIHAGDVQPLSERYLAANELVHAARETARSLHITEEEELYLLTLLRSTDSGSRPPPDDVPGSLRAARGLAYADSVDDYLRDLRVLDLGEQDPPAQRIVTTIAEHVRRIEALDGNVDLATTERLVRATQDVGEYLRTGNETLLASARERLDSIV